MKGTICGDEEVLHNNANTFKRLISVKLQNIAILCASLIDCFTACPWRLGDWRE